MTDDLLTQRLQALSSEALGSVTDCWNPSHMVIFPKGLPDPANGRNFGAAITVGMEWGAFISYHAGLPAELVHVLFRGWAAGFPQCKESKMPFTTWPGEPGTFHVRSIARGSNEASL